jgi:hypothetical protein
MFDRDLARIILEETRRTSLQLIWSEEMRPRVAEWRLTSASKTPTETELLPETAEIAPDEPETANPAPNESQNWAKEIPRRLPRRAVSDIAAEQGPQRLGRQLWNHAVLR